MQNQTYLSRLLGALLLVTMIAFSNGCLGPDQPHPSDKELLDNFSAHEQEFAQLVEMCKEDAGMSWIGPDFLWRTDNAGWPRPESEWGITRERWDAYRELFTKLNIKLSIGNYQPDLILVVANSRGNATSSTSKGYAYATEPPKPVQILDSLENFNWGEGATEDIYYRHIKDNWYIYMR